MRHHYLPQTSLNRTPITQTSPEHCAIYFLPAHTSRDSSRFSLCGWRAATISQQSRAIIWFLNGVALHSISVYSLWRSQRVAFQMQAHPLCTFSIFAEAKLSRRSTPFAPAYFADSRCEIARETMKCISSSLLRATTGYDDSSRSKTTNARHSFLSQLLHAYVH